MSVERALDCIRQVVTELQVMSNMLNEQGNVAHAKFLTEGESSIVGRLQLVCRSMDEPPDFFESCGSETKSTVVRPRHRTDYAEAAESKEVGQWLQETFSTKKTKTRNPTNSDEPDPANASRIVRGIGPKESPQGSPGQSTTSFNVAIPTNLSLQEERRVSFGLNNEPSGNLQHRGSSATDTLSVHSRHSTPSPTVASREEQILDSSHKGRFNRTMSRTTTCDAIQLQSVLSKYNIPYLEVDDPDFDIFQEIEHYGDRNIMVLVAANVFFRYSMFQSLDLDYDVFMEFLGSVQAHYRRENPYHNHIHAADVLQTTHVYLCIGNVKENFVDAELLAVLFAAVVHDVGHLGISNAFLVKTGHPLASLYNDNSPLESMHASLAFSILQRHNFFQNSKIWTSEMNLSFRSRVVDIVVGTDMKFHAGMINTVTEILADGQIDDEEVTYLFKSIVHAADLSNPMKPRPIYQNWLNRVMAEFWQQGDQERLRGMPISVMCDRHTACVAKVQAGFISFIVKPFVHELSSLLPDVWMERLQDNLTFMTNYVGEYPMGEIENFAAVAWEDSWGKLFDVQQLLQNPGLSGESRKPAVYLAQTTFEIELYKLIKQDMKLIQSQQLAATAYSRGSVIADTLAKFSVNFCALLFENAKKESLSSLPEVFPEFFVNKDVWGVPMQSFRQHGRPPAAEFDGTVLEGVSQVEQAKRAVEVVERLARMSELEESHTPRHSFKQIICATLQLWIAYLHSMEHVLPQAASSAAQLRLALPFETQRSQSSMDVRPAFALQGKTGADIPPAVKTQGATLAPLRVSAGPPHQLRFAPYSLSFKARK
jgi:hypothetical protein